MTDLDAAIVAAIVESSDDAIVTKTLGGIVRSWNPAAERIFGYRADEMIGQSITLLFPPDRIDEEAAFIARIVRGERVEHFETVRVRKDGQQIHVSVSLSPLRNDRGEIVGVSKIARDISERVRLLERERAAREEAEQANRVKDQFLATLSHELRTPLNAIFGWTRMLRTSDLDPAARERALQVIERNARAQMEMITELLDVSRIISGRVSLSVRALDLTELVAATVESARPTATARGVVLHVHCAGPVPAVIGDPDRLQQVVSNLLTNAIKFTEGGGRVDVDVRQKETNVEVTVTDTGVGIDAELLPHVFERFRQADASSGRRHSGLGLGLAIARHIVELHGGVISATSEGRGRGASFKVTLPVTALRPAEPAPRGSVAEAIPLPAHVLKESRVLVVDDDDDARELIAEALRRAGATVFRAASANEALDVMAVERPDVVVSDLGMPGEDGFALIRRIRTLSHAELARTPVIALTAYARDADRYHARQAGFDDFLAKPVEPLELIGTVARRVLRAS